MKYLFAFLAAIYLPVFLFGAELEVRKDRLSIAFYREDGVVKAGPLCIEGQPVMRPAQNAFLTVNGEPFYATRVDPIDNNRIRGVSFSGKSYIAGNKLLCSGSCYFDYRQSLPLLNWEIAWEYENTGTGLAPPRVLWESVPRDGKPNGQIVYINSLAPSKQPVLVNRGYPLIWLYFHTNAGDVGCLLYDDVSLDSPDGKYFVFEEQDNKARFMISSMDANSDPEFAKYYWNFKHLPSMFPDIPFRYYPETRSFTGGEKHTFRYSLLPEKTSDIFTFCRKYSGKAFDMVLNTGKGPFAGSDWDRCALEQLAEFADTDEKAGERYVKGKGWYSAPVKDNMSHGPGNVVSTGSASALTGLLYYSKVTDNLPAYEFYVNRLADIDFSGWAGNGKDGFFNEFWTRESGYDIHWSSMWSIFDMGAWGLYNIAKITGDGKVYDVFRGLMDYGRRKLLDENLSLGEHWNDLEEEWYYLTPESAYTKAEKAGGAHPVYPGTMAVFAYLTLLEYADTKDPALMATARRQIDTVNTFLSKPHLFYTLCRIPKTNGFAFALAANVRLYEMTGDEYYLDRAEDFCMLLLAAYHLRDENGHETGFAHASYLGEFDYVCVSSLETIEPLYLACRLLRYRRVVALEKLLAAADGRHLYAYGANHKDKTALYGYIPLELVPQGESYAQYMGGPIMIENAMLHGLHTVSDPGVTCVCLDAAALGTGVKDKREMLLINPHKKPRKVTLSLRHLGKNRQYKVVREGREEILSEKLLSKGISCNIPAEASASVLVEAVE